MANSSSDYWQERVLKQADWEYKQTAEYMANIEKQYRKATKNIQKQINAWYTRFATENDMSLSEAKKMLNGRELEEFRWDVEEYIAKAQEGSQWAKQLERASTRVHVSRLESLKLQMQQEIEMLAGHETDSMDKFLSKMFEEDYYRNVFNVFQGVGIGRSFAQLDTTKIRKALERPWAYPAANFSSRIWTNKKKLINTLDTELTQMIITGEKPDTVVKRVAQKMDTSMKNASRLVQTEEAHISQLARAETYKELDIERFIFVCTLDARTCSTCGTLDGQMFNEKDRMEGINCGPMHPYCRCTDAPYYDDMEQGTRTARDDEGKTYRIDGEITYEEWRNGLRSKKGRYDPDEDVFEIIDDVEGSLSKAKNIDELTEMVKAKWNIEGFHSKNGTYFERIALDDLRTLDFEAVKQTFMNVDRVFEEFPELRQSKIGFGITNSGDSFGEATYGFEDGSMQFSFGPDFKNLKKVESEYARKVKAGKAPAGTTYVDVGVHEMGHIVEQSLFYAKHGTYKDLDKHEISKLIKSEAWKSVKKQYAEMGIKSVKEAIADISGYATTNSGEMMAEAFADYFANGPNAKLLSKEIMRITKEMWKDTFSEVKMVIKMGDLADSLDEKHITTMKEFLDGAPKSVQTVWNKYVEDVKILDAHYTGGPHYSPTKRGVNFDIESISKDQMYLYKEELGKEAYNTVFHEIGHNISSVAVQKRGGGLLDDMGDFFKSTKYEGYSLTDMLREEASERVDKYLKELQDEAVKQGLKKSSVRKVYAYDKVREELLAEKVVEVSSTCDMMDGATKGSVRGFYGHSKDYWGSVNVGVEAFAEMFSATVRNGKDLIGIKKYFPKSYELFLEMMDDLAKKE